MKKLLSTMLVAVLMLSLIPMANAADTRVYTLDEIAEIWDLDVAELRQHQDQKAQATKSPTLMRGPAPALRAVDVVMVASQQGGTEYLGFNQSSTVLDHKGAWMDVMVDEWGYGQANYATFNGTRMVYAQSMYYDSNGDSIADGIYRLYQYDFAVGSGNVYAQSTSSNYPQNTYSDLVYVR